MSVISIYESEVSCLSSILDLQRKCIKEKVELSTETNNFLLRRTLKQVGPSVAQKVVSKLVAQGEITWEQEEEFEVESILDYTEEDGVNFYLIKWRGWSHAHNSWEPKDNLNCVDLIEEFHVKNDTSDVKAGTKRKFEEVYRVEDEREQKRTRIDELFDKLITCKEIVTPLRFISLTSPDKGKVKLYRGLVSCEGLRLPKFNNTAKQLLNPRTKAYKKKKLEIKKALKDWEDHMNSLLTDPAKVFVENEVDLEGPPENFEYINDYKPGQGIEIPNDPVIGCECEECWSAKGDCCPHQFGVEFAYYKQKRLKLPRGRPIYECNKRCKCGPLCSNRVVQQGRKHRVCIFRTSNGRGWGVKAMQKIKAGTFVMEYVGEVISSEEAEIRGQTYDAVGRTYLFDLDFNDGDCPFTVDAAVYGNVSHFVNHSCDPNLEVYSVWINTLDPRLPRIALFSRRDIEKGDELTFDYMSSKVHSPLEESTHEASAETVTKAAEDETVDENDNAVAEIPSDDVEVIDLPSDSGESELDTGSGQVLDTDIDKNVSQVQDTKSDKTSQTQETEKVKVTSQDTDLDKKASQIKDTNSDKKASQDEDSVTVKEASLVSDTDVNKEASEAKETDAYKEAKPVHDTDIDNTASQVEDTDNAASGITAGGDAESQQKPMFASPRKRPVKAATDVYRMVCQCGAKNCRKFVF